MGIIHHNAVIATTYGENSFNLMKDWIEKLQLEKTIAGLDSQKLFIFGDGIANEYYTIVLIPDGSKEGWPDSALGDSLREMFINKLKETIYDDGSSHWSWIEVGFGECGQQLLQGNNKYA